MAISHKNIFLILVYMLNFCMMNIVGRVSATGAVYTPPSVENVTGEFSRVAVNKEYYASFGSSNVKFNDNGTSADLILDKITGAGLMSKNRYYYGFFNAAMKLPAGFTSGIVIAFYLSNADLYPHNHDEIDIELLGHEKRREWIMQTNLYGNGSVSTGREEKFYLWFDPTQAFHDYTILWNNHHIVFLVDNVPVREIIHNAAISPVYPSKPMSVFATIWDGSIWATHGGKYPVNYQYAPFIVSLKGTEMEGCVLLQQQNNNDSTACSRSSPSSLDPVDGLEFAQLSQQQNTGLEWARGKHMFYSYCQDTTRYKVLPPECRV